MTVFRIYGGIGKLGAFASFLFVVFALLAVFNTPPHIICWLIFAFFFGFTGIPLLTVYLVSRVFTDDDKIIFRNTLGITRQIPWRDVRCVYVYTMNGDIKVCGNAQSFKIFSGFAGFSKLLSQIKEHCPSAFDTEAVLKWKDFRTKNGAQVFHMKKPVAVTGSILVLMAATVVVFAPDALFKPLFGSSFLAKMLTAAMFGVPGCYLILLGCVSKLYISEDGIAKRNWFGTKHQIRWQDIRSVQVRKGNNPESLRVKAKGNVISVSIHFYGYAIIKELIEKRYPRQTGKKHKKAPGS